MLPSKGADLSANRGIDLHFLLLSGRPGCGTSDTRKLHAVLSVRPVAGIFMRGIDVRQFILLEGGQEGAGALLQACGLLQQPGHHGQVLLNCLQPRRSSLLACS